MRYILFFAGILILGALIFTWSCSKQSGRELEGLVSITLTPGDTAIALGQPLQFKATGHFLNNVTRDITSQVQWSSNPSGKLNISGSGYVTTIDTGATYVTAGAMGIVAGRVTLIATASQVDRILVLWYYNNRYVASDVNDALLGWTGDITTCKPGLISATAQKNTLMRINYFRRLVGLPDNVTFDSLKNVKCQQAALMMHANNQVSASPPPPWTCWTQQGADAAAASNLLLNAHSSTAITKYIEDFGATKADCPDRRWLLFSRALVMGHGATTKADAVWILGNNGNPLPANPPFIAYPPKGYVPAPLVFLRWSFAIPEADFSAANVTMVDKNNAPVAVTVASRATGSGDNSIIWEPAGIVTTGPGDNKYSVTVSNVKINGNPTNYTYDVTIIQP